MIPPPVGSLATRPQRVTPAAAEEAVRSIESWLLDSGAQLAEGPHRGGVAGWLDAGGRPEFVYLEISGYYLTALAWLAGGAASSEARAADALARGREVLAWMRVVTAAGAVPPTRIHLSPGADDWRNAAVFSFDLAMAARGVATFASADPAAEATVLARDLGARLGEVCRADVPLASHRASGSHRATLPDKWSTRPGPHHAKAAAAMARLPAGVLDAELDSACLATIGHWTAAMEVSWPCQEVHPLFYGLEGFLIAAPPGDEDVLDVVEPMFERLMRLQEEDGSLPTLTGPPSGGVRADVLAQALRVGAILRAGGRLAEETWEPRLDALAGALLAYVRPDGGVLFSREHPVANTWCAMFAHQALLLHANPGDGELASRAAALLV